MLISCDLVHVYKSVKYSVEQQTGELAEEGQESDMFDPLTPDMEQDDAVDKLYGNLSDGEIQVLFVLLLCCKLKLYILCRKLTWTDNVFLVA